MGGTSISEHVADHMGHMALQGALALEAAQELSCTHRPSRSCYERSEDSAISQRAGIAWPFFEVSIA